LKKQVKKRRGNDYKVRSARLPAIRSPMPDRYPWGTGIKELGIQM